MGVIAYAPGIGVIDVSGTNTAGTLSPIVSGNLYLAGGNNVTISQNGNSLTFSAGGAGSGVAFSRQDLWPNGAWSSSTVTAQGSASIRYLQLQQAVTFSRVDIPVVFSLQTTTTTATAAINISAGLVIYLRTGSTLSPIAGLLSTTTLTYASNTANYSNINGGRNS